MMRTERLILRQWNDEDLSPFAEMCRDKEVMEFFPKRLTKEESYSMGRNIKSLIAERGWGFWAVEVPGESHFIGFVGLHTPNDSMPFSPCVEIGWRLAKAYWGRGYATEAANEALRYAFTQLGLEEVVSFTTVNNLRSQAVMEKIGMSYASNFEHPDLEPSDPLCEHVLYKISKEHWEKHS
ncbi:Protein N-acetyltransferase, RimJ/RimL family [Onishia taeanensis]|uniref:Protein N-acetyltransferase, RimJ/RimL family n=1 Tax=Onishia taeanensis TaxID=284577 RepID=A0A1G7RI99_9GAMM|nr:GNAT family N-acetyltransferase [Halomonas taeanensis]SDG10493.1 Protein N-acetyltransferase, RimJ/RimL family [Halomonas taeanensis]